MNGSRRAHRIFLESRALAADERERYVHDACGDDPALRAEVQGLAESALEVETRLSRLAERIARPGGQTSQAFPSHVGPYRVLQLIGRGGMGAVYLAERADGEFDHRVAIKMLPHAMAAANAEQRFRRERQILARLDHPNICHLLDGGVTPDGIPYFVMDLIDGRRIDEYCDAARLTLRLRLTLFLQVLAAVQFAHAKLILHRDLKPSNILVDAEGQVRLLDFGVAKLLEESSADEQTVAPLTPGYASPEVMGAGDAPVGTAADVYSLGVLLYQLLAGLRPYRRDGAGVAQLLQQIQSSEPDLASRRVVGGGDEGDRDMKSLADRRRLRPDTLASALRGDLDNLLAKALARDPARRYGSVQAFQDDIERYLHHRPLLARPPSFAYIARKFLRRNRWPVAFAGLLAVALITVAALSVRHAGVMARQNEVVAAERDRSDALSGFLLGMFQDATPDQVRPGAELTARELIDTGVNDLRSDGALPPATKADLMAAAGQLYHYVGEYDESIALYGEALELRRAIDGSDSPVVAELLMQLVLPVEAKGDWQEAERLAEQAAAIAEVHGQTGISAFALMIKGRVRHVQDDLTAARAYYQRARDLFSRLPADADRSRSLSLLDNLAVLERQTGNADRAETLHVQALALTEELFGAGHIEMVPRLLGLGQLMFSTGRYRQARKHLLDALSITRSSVGMTSNFAAYLYNSLGTLERLAGNLAESEDYYRRSLAVWLGINPHHLNAGLAHSALGKTLLDRRKYAEAEQEFASAGATISGAAPGDWRVHDTASRRAAALIGLGRLQEAQTVLMPARDLLVQAVGSGHPAALAADEHVAALRAAQADDTR